jgi:hypothetical protein
VWASAESAGIQRHEGVVIVAGVALFIALVVLAVLRPCSHKERIWAKGRLQCMACGHPVEVLPQAVIRGPAHEPDQVRGIPNVWATTVRKDNVAKFERISER